MKIKKQTKYEIEVNRDEYNLIKDCLAYCQHRRDEHEKCGLMVDDDALEKLREDFFYKEK